jgi:hypothetical protein
MIEAGHVGSRGRLNAAIAHPSARTAEQSAWKQESQHAICAVLVKLLETQDAGQDHANEARLGALVDQPFIRFQTTNPPTIADGAVQTGTFMYGELRPTGSPGQFGGDRFALRHEHDSLPGDCKAKDEARSSRLAGAKFTFL